jgi:multiple sugar transport system substrate-binding protein
MSEYESPTHPRISRRSFLGAAAGATLAAGLATACGSSASSKTAGTTSGGAGATKARLKFWDMGWGSGSGDQYVNIASATTKTFRQGGYTASYQPIAWTNFNETFASAIASETGPAVSSGGGFQAFQYAQQGAIAYADDLLDSWKTNGLYADLVPGSLAAMKTANGYAAIPWNLDVICLWYRKTALDDAGVTALPTTWDEYLTVAEQLAKKKYYAFGAGNGAGNSFGYEPMWAMMINNGGGLFDSDGNLDVVSERNIEAVSFVLELVKMGAVDPGSVSYTAQDYLNKWSDKSVGIGWYDGFLDAAIKAVGEVFVADPLTSPNGTKGTIQYINNLMMYKNTPSQEGSEEFLTYYVKNLYKLWDAKAISMMPALNSIVRSESFRTDTQAVRLAENWQPIAKTLAAQSVPLTPILGKIDGGTASYNFADTVLAGRGTAKAALVALENGIKSVVSS